MVGCEKMQNVPKIEPLDQTVQILVSIYNRTTNAFDWKVVRLVSEYKINVSVAYLTLVSEASQFLQRKLFTCCITHTRGMTYWAN